jgi:hypothetical protein
MIKHNSGTYQPALSINSGVNAELKKGIFIIGGGDRPNPNTVVYSPDVIEWTTIGENLPFLPRINQTLLNFKGDMYMMGGYGYNEGHFNFNDVWRSDDGTNWKKIATAPWQARSGNAGVVYGGEIYIIGGETYNASGSTFYNDVWKSVDGIKWTKDKMSAPWSARSVGGATIFQNKIFIIGGGSYVLNADGTYDFTVYKDIWSYDGENWKQELSETPWNGAGVSGVFVQSGKLFVITDDGLHSNIIVWNSDDGKVWNKVTDATNFPNYNFNAFSYAGKMWLAGGTKDEEFYDGLWSSTDGITWQESQNKIKGAGGEGHPALVVN